MKSISTFRLVLLVAFILVGKLSFSYADEPQSPKPEILKQYQLIVKGLECKKCIPDVQKPLLKIKGVRDAKVIQFDTSGSITHVEVVPDSVSGEQLVLALQAVGLKAEVDSVGEPREILLMRNLGFSFFELFN